MNPRPLPCPLLLLTVVAPSRARADIGCSVLVEFDMIYRTRFWTSFEAWLSFMQATENGIVSATGDKMRCTAVCMPGTHESYARALEAEWANVDAREAYEKLASPDVTVTNQSDKEMQLPKIAALDETVRTMMLAWKAASSRPASAHGGGVAAVRAAAADEVPACAVVGLAELLASCHLQEKLAAAVAWCEEEDVKSVKMIKDAEVEDDFIEALGLKKVPAKALRKMLTEA